MTLKTISTEISLERPRKYPAGHPIRIGVRCKGCSHGCTIDLRLPDEFPSVYVERIVGVFSTLCEKLAEDRGQENGQPKALYDANEV